MAWYRTLGPVTYTDGDQVRHITKAGIRIDITPLQAAELAGMIVLDRTTPFTYPRADFLKYESSVLFPTEGIEDAVYLANDSGLLYRWIDDDYAEVSVSASWGNISEMPDVVAAGSTEADAQTALGGTAVGRAVFTADDEAAGREALGATEVGDAVFTGDAADGRGAIGVHTIVPVDKYGSDYSTALSAAIDAAAAVGGTVVHEAGKTYTANTAVTKTDVAVRIDWNGARVIRASSMSNSPVLAVGYSNSTPQSVVGLTNMAYAWGDVGSTTTPSTRIELSSTSGWAAGDWAVIVGDDAIPGAIVAEGQREGERVRVLAVSGSYLYTARPLRVTLTTSIRIARLTVKDCVLVSPWFEDASGSPTARNAAAITVTQAVSPRLVDAKGYNLLGECVLFLGCVNGVIDGSDMHNLRTSFDDTAYGYGFHLSSCNDFSVINVRGSNLRHLITTGARKNTTAGSADLWRFGASLGHRIEGKAGEVGHSAFDTHDEAAYVTFDNCFVGWNHKEPSGSLFAYKIRGRSNTLRDSTSVGPGAVVLQAEDGGGGHKVINHTHIVPPGYGSQAGGFSIEYGNRSTRGDAEVSGRVYMGANPGRVLYADTARVHIPHMEIAAANATNPYRPFQLVDSELNIDTLIVDLRGSTGDTRIFYLTDSLSSVKVENLIVRADGATWRVGEFNNLNGSISVARVHTDTAPHTFDSGFVGTGGTPSKYVGEFIINGEPLSAGVETRADAAVSLTAYSKGTQYLSVPLTAHRTVTEPVYNARAGRTILYVRTAAATGAFTWTVGDDSLTVAGSWLRRMWTGSAWVTVGKGLNDAQPRDTDLDTIAAISADGFLKRTSGAWAPADLAHSDLSASSRRIINDRLTGGFTTVPRWAAGNSSLALTSGTMRFSYFDAPISDTLSNITVLTGNTPAAATPTLIRFGLFSVDGSGNLTLIADTPNDTTLLAAASTAYTKAFTTPVAVTLGQRLAWAPIIVTGATAPNLAATGHVGAAEMAIAPRITGQLTGQTDLPASVSNGTVLTSGTGLPYVRFS